jgi:hypothetical protein
MRIIPEYEPVGKLYLSFVQQFFHSRFNYGKAICDIAKAVADRITVEVFVSENETEFFLGLLEQNDIKQDEIVLNHDSPERSIIQDYFPIFGEDEEGIGIGLLFSNERMNNQDHLYRFSERVLDSIGIPALVMNESFATAKISVNEDLCLISEYLANGDSGLRRLQFLRKNFPSQVFVPVPTLKGDSTKDLDMYLWPIKPGIWLASQYPENSSQEQSVRPAIRRIEEHGHEVIRIPGLDRIAYDDVNTMPNYANGILINGCALYPSYCKPEDEIVGEILKANGLEAIPIDCRDIILSNSGLHCISKTVPRQILADNHCMNQTQGVSEKPR